LFPSYSWEEGPNNQAEFEALIEATEALRWGFKKIIIEGNSKIIIDLLNGKINYSL
jgi:ribonuclease HI